PAVVIVEDEHQIRRFVRSTLEAEGCRVYEAATAREGLVEAATRQPDLIVLDLGLPDRDGIEFIRDLRGWSEAPVIVLSARSAEADKVTALDAGADDYLAKPFGVAELTARVKALLRRHARGQDGSAQVAFGDVTVDLARRTVMRAGEIVHLTSIEYRLLVKLVTNAGKVMTHRHLLRDVWGPSYVESAHYVRIYVSRLRQKLEIDPTRPRHLLTETGVGYRFQP
ncbi:MAG TPA: two-component system response regulator KdpE, partial [Burkholderiaceae bacterium]|nr:two-component system response regulator KdpE [Burkholderiaceae bacterium]